MGMNASQLDRRVQFLRAELIDDGFGNVTGSFEPLGTKVAAWRRDVSDSEKVSAGRLQSEVVTRFRVRSTSFTRGITAADRLSSEGATFEILGIKQTEERRTFLEITAVAGVWA
ncbi:head-tail adaptor protein [Frigidibacter albus]|uniref:Head-tail adaptor protein n=1 Tax=Frigidibacter albus TaxID=1465486 RepID=A0A6L8VJA2_9RHOB|nr:head-tail adaptor protein [Frigidibacter albus]MZQ89250.1 head-tail adaptor protein [Frigidibacter albus]NBE31156.1 head-tail adaptor protein [Frigidibacter albus]GGH53177.1 phage head-tail adapter protein [Frigidibacter albus]